MSHVDTRAHTRSALSVTEMSLRLVKFETLGRISLHFSYSRALYTLAVYFLLCVGALALSLLSVYALVTSIGLTGYT